jgi:hypothetical protein
LKDTALAIIGLNSLSEELWSVDDDRAFEYELQLQEKAVQLALEVMDFNPLEGHTRLGEVRAYAHRNGICVHEAIIRLVNSALSHQLDREV